MSENKNNELERTAKFLAVGVITVANKTGNDVKSDIKYKGNYIIEKVIEHLTEYITIKK